MGTKILRALPLLALTAFCLSCSSSGEYDFKNGDDAITAYRNYLVEVRNLKTSNTKDLLRNFAIGASSTTPSGIISRRNRNTSKPTIMPT